MTSLVAPRTAADGRRTNGSRPTGLGRPASARRFPVRSVIAAACVAVTWFWWAGTPAASGATPGTALVAVSELVGLLASVLVCAQLLLVARVPWFERAVGLDRLVSWHRSLGTTVVLLVVTHVLGMIVGQQLVTGDTPWGALRTLLATTSDLWLALAGTIVFLAVGLSSARLLRRHLTYEWWYAVHVTIYGAIAATFLHQVSAGVHFAGVPLARAAWFFLYGATAWAVVWWRALLPLARHVTFGVRVVALVDEGGRATSVWLRGRRLDRLAPRAGQFFLVRFLASGHILTSHPYSLSLVPTDDHLRFTVGALGDHSAAVASLRPGTRVLLEGPFGRMTADRARSRRVLLIAGGAGIGPVRALAEELVNAGRDVVVLHRAHSADELALAAEFPTTSRLRYVPVAGRRRELGYDPLVPSAIAALVPDIGQRDVFVSGPPPMVDAVVASVRALGVPRAAIHTEELSLA
ncbi:MAG TPA: ferredoxin reductase family protein [Cellulomonas sp.]